MKIYLSGLIVERFITYLEFTISAISKCHVNNAFLYNVSLSEKNFSIFLLFTWESTVAVGRSVLFSSIIGC